MGVHPPHLYEIVYSILQWVAQALMKISQQNKKISTSYLSSKTRGNSSIIHSSMSYASCSRFKLARETEMRLQQIVWLGGARVKILQKSYPKATTESNYY